MVIFIRTRGALRVRNTHTHTHKMILVLGRMQPRTSIMILNFDKPSYGGFGLVLSGQSLSRIPSAELSDDYYRGLNHDQNYGAIFLM